MASSPLPKLALVWRASSPDGKCFTDDPLIYQSFRLEDAGFWDGRFITAPYLLLRENLQGERPK